MTFRSVFLGQWKARVVQRWGEGQQVVPGEEVMVHGVWRATGQKMELCTEK